MHASWDTAALQLILALLLDATVGEYPHLLHPVVWIGSAVKALRRLAPASGWWRQFLFGTLIVVLICGLTALASFLVVFWTSSNQLAEIVAGALLLKSSFALRELGRAAAGVAEPLQHGDLVKARAALRSLCSRDPSDLNAQELLAGTVESLAENASDSFVAPVFYFLLLGIPGALVYRAINTMDAMIGYRGPYEALGKAAARIDDAANWIPARLTAVGLLLAGLLMRRDFAAGWSILWRDGGKTASPNAGRPMAAMAGLLGVRLEKKNDYALGDAHQQLAPATVCEAWRLVVCLACATAIVTLAGLAWANWMGCPAWLFATDI